MSKVTEEKPVRKWEETGKYIDEDGNPCEYYEGAKALWSSRPRSKRDD